MSRRKPSIGKFTGLVCCAFVGAVTPGVFIAQSGVSTQRPPAIAPGQSVSGKDHPEYFSRRIALEMMLNLLAIDPENALSLQRRARLIESKRMQLSIADTAVLEQTVETYRVQRNELNVRAAAVQAAHGNFQELNIERKVLVKQTLHQLSQQMSPDGKQRINAFVNDIISKSEMRQAGKEVAK